MIEPRVFLGGGERERERGGGGGGRGNALAKDQQTHTNLLFHFNQFVLLKLYSLELLSSLILSKPFCDSIVDLDTQHCAVHCSVHPIVQTMSYHTYYTLTYILVRINTRTQF